VTAVLPDVRAYVAEHDLTSRSPWRSTARTTVIVLLYAGSAAVAFSLERWFVWAAAWTLQSVILVGSYSAMHEAGHGTLYRSRRVNRVVGALWASTILMNWSLWRSFHLEHHAHTGGEGDPETRYRVDITRRWQYLLMPLGGLQVLGELWLGSLGTLAGRFPSYVRTRTGRAAIRVDAVILLGVTASMLFGLVVATGVLLRLWVAPFLLAACVVSPGTALNEHYGCDTSGDALQTSRTVLSNRIVRFLLWNGNYHAGHHLVPSVPFHHAPALHAYVAPHTGYIARSYTSFHLEVLRSCGRR
jgi:fatty acid desaturase